MGKGFYPILLIAIALIICSSNINWGGNHWRGIIGSDGKGYYAYLPAVFIYHDLNLNFFEAIEKEYSIKETFYDYRTNDEAGHVYDKYFCGTSILISPFFMLAHLLTILTGNQVDGYSLLYSIFVNIAALSYLTLALVYLKRLLDFYTDRQNLISFVLLSFTFGTNIFYYAVSEPSMSHIYSFFCITALLYNFKCLSLKYQAKQLYLCSFLLGLIVLIRPVNGIVVFIFPFFFQSRGHLLAFFHECFSHWKRVILSGMIFFALTSVQLILFKIETGRFIIDSYSHEHFNWTRPELLNILFSYKKGLFVYTPMILLSFTGLYFLPGHNGFQTIVFLLFFILLSYVLSSWWCWYYGGSFGLRAYVEYYSLFAILLTVSLDAIKNEPVKKMFITLICFAIFLNLFQTYQYRYYLIHWSDMTKEKYWNVFLRIP